MSHVPFQVLVIGAGLGGLCLAQGLYQAGVEVAVYERDSALTGRPQGHRIHVDTRGEQALHYCLPPALDELFLATRGQPSRGLSRFSLVDGQLREESTQLFPAEGGDDAFATVGSAVDRLTLRQILLAGLEDRVRFDKTFVRYEQQTDGRVCVAFADGTSARGDVLVAADGVGSRIRRQFLPQTEVIETDMRWLGGKTVLTDVIMPLLPARLHETFVTVSELPHPNAMLGGVWFRTPPAQAAAELWPGLRFHHTADYVMWGLLGSRDQFTIPDERLQAMGSAELQRTAMELTRAWYPALAPLIQRAEKQECFFLTMRRATPVEPWPAYSPVTLLGDAIHVMPANGSGANSALRDASRLALRLIDVAYERTPLHRALRDYECEMLRSAFGAADGAGQGLRWGGAAGISPDTPMT
jgi:2-polyprenyl-6-methoxyphenol hydroxylase-like FAD-dependent oxidoreductase